MIAIFDILFEVLPYLIWGAGPFCVFKGMGTGKDSGKLLFKKIYSDGGVTITENSTNLDFSIIGGPTDPIDTCEIAYGTGTGITSSSWYVDDASQICGLFGIGVLNSGSLFSLNENISGFPYPYGNLVISGYENKHSPGPVGPGPNLYCTLNSLIVGGCSNCFKSNIYHLNSSIIGSMGSCIFGYSTARFCNNFLSAYNSQIYQSNSSFISGYKNYSRENRYSSVSGVRNEMLARSAFSQIISGHSNDIKCSYYSSIINGRSNVVYASTTLNCIFYSSIVNGLSNCIDGSFGLVQTPASIRSLILNGSFNKLYGTENNSILNGNLNVISSYLDTFTNQYKSPTLNSVILNGFKNFINLGQNSAIVNGCCNRIYGTKNSGPANPGDLNCSSNNLILGGRCNQIFWGENNIILGEDKGKINKSLLGGGALYLNGSDSSNNNVLLGGNINKAQNSVVFGGFDIFELGYSSIVGTFSSSTQSTSSNVIFCSSGRIVSKCDGKNNVIFGGLKAFSVSRHQYILDADRSSILFGAGNMIFGTASSSTDVKNTSMIASRDSKIFGRKVCNSVIIGSRASNIYGPGTGTYQSSIISSYNSVICAGRQLSILNSHSSIICANPTNGSSVNASIISSCDSTWGINTSTFNQLCNVVMIGITGSCCRIGNNSTLVGNLHILGTVSVLVGGVKSDGVNFCQINFASINSITVCRGIVTNIN
jgi:hypothetical protein